MWEAFDKVQHPHMIELLAAQESEACAQLDKDDSKNRVLPDLLLQGWGQGLGSPSLLRSPLALWVSFLLSTRQPVLPTGP